MARPPASGGPPLVLNLLFLCFVLYADRPPTTGPCHMVCKDKTTDACPGFPPAAHMREPNSGQCLCGTWPNVVTPACELSPEPQGWIMNLIFIFWIVVYLAYLVEMVYVDLYPLAAAAAARSGGWPLRRNLWRGRRPSDGPAVGGRRPAGSKALTCKGLAWGQQVSQSPTPLERGSTVSRLCASTCACLMLQSLLGPWTRAQRPEVHSGIRLASSICPNGSSL